MMARRTASSSGSGSAQPSAPPADKVISPQLRERLTELLRDDVAQLRRYMSPQFDGWGLG